MIIILVAALITALSAGYLVHPLMKSDSAAARRQGIALLLLLPACALGLYLWHGNPDLPSKMALFEKTGIRASLRAPARQEMELMRLLAAHPDDTSLMLALGDVRLRANHTDDALSVLAIANQTKPKDHAITMELGAAHYAAALDALRDGGGKAAALPHIDEALRIAPPDAPYRKQLLADRKELLNLKP